MHFILYKKSASDDINLFKSRKTLQCFIFRQHLCIQFWSTYSEIQFRCDSIFYLAFKLSHSFVVWESKVKERNITRIYEFTWVGLSLSLTAFLASNMINLRRSNLLCIPSHLTHKFRQISTKNRICFLSQIKRNKFQGLCKTT